MAKDSIDGILVRLDEIEKLQTELRHLVPRVTSNSSRNVRHQDLSRDTSASIRFPSLFTFPVISNFTSSARNERVPKSAAQLNLNDKLSSSNQSSTVNLKRGSSQRESSVRGTNIFKNLLKGTDKNVARSHAESSLASTSAVNHSRASKTSTKEINCVAKDPQKVIRKELMSRASKIVTKDNKMQSINGESSSMRLSENENNINTIRSSVQTSIIHAKPRDVRSSLGRKRHRNRKEISIGTFIQRIMKKLNYCFVDDNRVTVPYHYPGNTKPRRVKGTRLRLFAVQSFVN